MWRYNTDNHAVCGGEVHYSARQYLRSDDPVLRLPGRNQHPGEKLLSDLIVVDKRRRKDVLSLEEELLTYKFLVREEWRGMWQPAIISILTHPTAADICIQLKLTLIWSTITLLVQISSCLYWFFFFFKGLSGWNQRARFAPGSGPSEEESPAHRQGPTFRMCSVTPQVRFIHHHLQHVFFLSPKTCD